MKKLGKDMKEKRVTSLLGEEPGGEGDAGDDLSQVGFYQEHKVIFSWIYPKDFGRDHEQGSEIWYF